jgi:hypothetical protein
MPREPKITSAMRDVLAAVVDAPAGDPTWGFRICETTGRGPGDVYPALE